MIKIIKNTIFIFLVFSMPIFLYWEGATQRSRAKYGLTTISPDKEYKITLHYITVGEPMVILIRVYDKSGNLIAKHTRTSWPGAAVEDWDGRLFGPHQGQAPFWHGFAGLAQLQRANPLFCR